MWRASKDGKSKDEKNKDFLNKEIPSFVGMTIKTITIMKTYVLMISRQFPATHKRRGEMTEFIEKILSNPNTTPSDEIFGTPEFLNYTRRDYDPKIHTIRGNYELWRKRFKEIEKGNACLSLRYWEGKPYRSKQVEFLRFDRHEGIGLQKMNFINNDFVSVSNGFRELGICDEVSRVVSIDDIAKNDGLSLSDFNDWFKGYDWSEPMAIIHFTRFRY